jgi:hypothetical protein
MVGGMFYRRIYYLEFRFSPVDMCVIALNRHGQNATGNSNGHPRPPVKRTIDLRPCDQMLSEGQWCTIKSVRAWRDFWLTEEEALKHVNSDDGYLYCPKRQPLEKPTRVHVEGVERWLVKYAEGEEII